MHPPAPHLFLSDSDFKVNLVISATLTTTTIHKVKLQMVYLNFSAHQSYFFFKAKSLLVPFTC